MPRTPGSGFLNTGDIEGAIRQLQAAIGSASNHAPAHYWLGLALIQQGHSAEAQMEFQKAASLDPRFTPLMSDKK